MLNQSIPAGVTVTCHYVPDLPIIQGYGRELNQVWTNIILNALQAMGEEGKLTITAHVDDTGEWIIVTFTDSGPGIPPENLERIFEPFFTTKSEGTGLGLAIVARIVEAHGGSIDVANCPEGGAAFTIRLPRPQVMEAAA